MVAWAYPEFVAKRVRDWVEKPTGPVVGFRMANGTEVYIDVNDPLGASPWLAVAELRRDRVTWACAADMAYLKECGVDVRDPVNHEVFAGDLARAMRDKFQPNPPFINPEVIEPSEMRIDPCTGKKATFGALRIQASDEGIIELKHFWHHECRLPGDPQSGQQRVDPLNGKALTLREFQELAADRFDDPTELELYWESECHPLPRRGKRPEREDVFVSRGGKGMGKGGYDGGDGGRAKPDLTADGMKPLDGEDKILEDLGPAEKKKVKKPAPPRKAWPQWPRRILQNQVDASLEEWLHSIDGRGVLCEYHIAIADSYDSTTQILDLYTRVREDFSKEWVGNEFFEDIGIAKIGHRKLFSKWFNDSLTLIDEEPTLDNIEEDEEAEREAELAVEAEAERERARRRVDVDKKARLATIAEDEAFQAAEDFLEEWG